MRHGLVLGTCDAVELPALGHTLQLVLAGDATDWVLRGRVALEENSDPRPG